MRRIGLSKGFGLRYEGLLFVSGVESMIETNLIQKKLRKFKGAT